MSPLEPGPIYAPSPGPPQRRSQRAGRRLDLVIGVLLGIVLGVAVAAAFVFWGAEDTVDAPRIDSSAPAMEAPADPSAARGER